MSGLEAGRPWAPASARWATWGSGMLCAATRDGENAGVLGHLDSEKVAEAARDDHNAMLDLAWLARAGFDVTVSWRAGTWRVEIPGTAYGALVMCGQGETPGAALAKARAWAEGRRA